MNLLADEAEGIVRRMKANGVDCDEQLAKADPVSFLARYLEYEGRRIDARPREVRISSELNLSPKSVEHAPALTELERRFKNGLPISPFQTKRISSMAKVDLLLTDWNVHHLHLGPLKPGASFADRAGDLLYVTVLESQAYFIDVRGHGAFSEMELLEVIDSNWPSYLDRFVLKGVQAVRPVPTSESVATLRAAGVQTTIPLRSGKILFPPGGGYSTAGTSISCMRLAQRTAQILRSVEDHVRTNADAICKKLGVADAEDVRLGRLEAGRAVLVGAAGGPPEFEVRIQE